MAIDQTTLAVNSCRKITTSVNKLLGALDELESINEQLIGADITLSSFELAISSTSETQHCDPVTYQNRVSLFSPSVVASLKALYDGSPTQQGWAAMQKARS